MVIQIIIIYLYIVTNNYSWGHSWGHQNNNISNEGVKEFGVNISKLTNLSQLNLDLRG